MYAEIIAIGDEIVSGADADTNSQWLSQKLEELGVRVLYHSTVGDELRLAWRSSAGPSSGPIS